MVICGRQLSNICKAAFPTWLDHVPCSSRQLKRLPHNRNPHIDPLQGPCGGGRERPDVVQMHACVQKKKKVRHFHRINIHYKQQHHTCILNRSLPNATVHPPVIGDLVSISSWIAEDQNIITVNLNIVPITHDFNTFTDEPCPVQWPGSERPGSEGPGQSGPGQSGPGQGTFFHQGETSDER